MVFKCCRDFSTLNYLHLLYIIITCCSELFTAPKKPPWEQCPGSAYVFRLNIIPGHQIE